MGKTHAITYFNEYVKKQKVGKSTTSLGLSTTTTLKSWHIVASSSTLPHHAQICTVFNSVARRGQNGKSRGIAEDESKEGERTPWLLRERSRQRSGGARLHGGHHLSRSWLLLASNPFFSRQEDSPKCTCQNASILIDEDRRPLVKHERP